MFASTNIPPRTGAAGEDYLEAILRLERTQGWARVGALAAALNVHKSTVTAMLKALAKRGLVVHQRYAAARLTPAGLAVATQTTARHALIRDFLVRMLLLGEEAADANACRMEHVLDARAADRLALLARLAAAKPRLVGNWRRALLAFMTAEERAAAGAGGVSS